MKVKVHNKMYRMSRTEYDGLLKIASEQVPVGVYAVEKKEYAELRCDRCSSMTQLKKVISQFRMLGFKVLFNKGENLEEGAGDTEKEGLMSAT